MPKLSNYKSMASKAQAEILGDAEFNKKWEQEGQFQFLRKSNDPRFGEISLFKNKGTNDLIFAKEKLVTSKQQASNDIRDLKSRMALNHNNLHKLIGYSTAVQKELCSTNYLTKAYYEFPKSDLQKEINDRKQNGGNFTGDELLNVGSQAVNGLAHLHKLDISHGDVRPLNIGYNRDSRNVQILDRLQDPSPLEKLQSNNIINKKDLYVAPELYRKLQGKDKTLKYNPYKNDLYGLGLSLLSAGNVDSVQNIYKPNGDLDQAALDAHLRNFDNKYAANSPAASQLVHTLLHKDENQRWEAQAYVDALRNGQLGHQTVTHVVHQEAPVTYTTHHVYSAPPAEEPTIVYQTEEPVPAQTNYVYAQPAQTTYYYNNVAPVRQVSYAAPVETVVYAEQAPLVAAAGPTTVTVTRLDGTTYTYTVDEKDRNNIVEEYEKHDPRGPNVEMKVPVGTLVETVAPNVVYGAPVSTVYASPTTYVDAPVYHTGKVYATPTETVTYVQPTSTPYRPANIHVSQASPVSYVNYAHPTYHPVTPVVVRQSISDQGVEVRRGSSQPIKAQDQAVKKKYIIEGDNVIEVNDD